MILAHVLGRVWADRQITGLKARRMLLVESVDDQRNQLVCVDLIDVSVGATVLIATDEAAAAATGDSTIDAAVIALVSDYDDRTPPTDITVEVN